MSKTPRSASREAKPMRKTTLRIDEEVWRAARIRALDERVGFQDIVDRALRASPSWRCSGSQSISGRVGAPGSRGADE